MKYERERAVLLCPQAYNNLLPGSVSSQLDYYTSKAIAVVSVMLTAVDIQGVDLSEPLVLFWHRHQEGTWNKLVTASLISLKHSKPSRSPISIARKSVEGGAWILAWVVVTTSYICPGVLHCSRMYLNRTSLPTYHC